MNGTGDLNPEMLSGYLDDELDADERTAVDARLAESAEWRAELEEVRAARLAVRGLPRRDAPPGFWDAVLANVAASSFDDQPDGQELEARDSVVPPTPLAPRRERRRLGWIVGAAAAATAVVVAVVVVPRHAEVKPDVAAVVAQHGALGSEGGDPVSHLAPVGPFAGFHR